MLSRNEHCRHDTGPEPRAPSHVREQSIHGLPQGREAGVGRLGEKSPRRGRAPRECARGGGAHRDSPERRHFDSVAAHGRNLNVSTFAAQTPVREVQPLRQGPVPSLAWHSPNLLRVTGDEYVAANSSLPWGGLPCPGDWGAFLGLAGPSTGHPLLLTSPGPSLPGNPHAQLHQSRVRRSAPPAAPTGEGHTSRGLSATGRAKDNIHNDPEEPQHHYAD